MKKLKYFIFLFLIYLTSNLYSYQTLKLKQASDYYREQKYQQALEIYLTKDQNNPFILYNIANCYYKMGNKTYALVYYLKAFKLLPRNKDIRYNLELTAKQTGQNIFSDSIPPFLYKLYYFLSEYELTAATTLSLFMLTLLLGMKMWTRNNSLTSSILLFLFLTLFFSTWYILRKNSIIYNSAVVIKETALYSGPSENFNMLATVKEAKIVKIISENEKENFVEVGITQENIKGWIKKDDIIKI